MPWPELDGELARLPPNDAYVADLRAWRSRCDVLADLVLMVLREHAERLAPEALAGHPFARYFRADDRASLLDLVQHARGLDELAAKLGAPQLGVSRSYPSLEPLEEQLIARIADDPQSDVPRLVLADHYLERGDPRGELMSLQLAGSSATARLAELLESQAPRMVGSLVNVLAHDSLRFERGRLAACNATFHTDDQLAFARGNPLWATVTDLATREPSIVADPMMRSVRRVHGLGIDAFAILCATDRPLDTIEELAIWMATVHRGTPAERTAIANTRCLPSLRRLVVDLYVADDPVRADDFLWLLDSPLGLQLASFGLRSGLTPITISEASFAAYRSQRGNRLELIFEPTSAR